MGRAKSKKERDAELAAAHAAKKRERMEKFDGKNLYVKNLSPDVDEDELRKIFDPHGDITSCVVMKGPDGVSRGFGFVCFDSPEQATRAVTEMKNKMIRGKPLYVALAQDGTERRKQLEKRYAMGPGPGGGFGGMGPGAMGGIGMGGEFDGFFLSPSLSFFLSFSLFLPLFLSFSLSFFWHSSYRSPASVHPPPFFPHTLSLSLPFLCAQLPRIHSL